MVKKFAPRNVLWSTFLKHSSTALFDLSRFGASFLFLSWFSFIYFILFYFFEFVLTFSNVAIFKPVQVTRLNHLDICGVLNVALNSNWFYGRSITGFFSSASYFEWTQRNKNEKSENEEERSREGMIEWKVASKRDEEWRSRNLNKKKHFQKESERGEMWRNKQQVKCQLAAVIMQDELVVNPTADRCWLPFIYFSIYLLLFIFLFWRGEGKGLFSRKWFFFFPSLSFHLLCSWPGSHHSR